jgi:hypothetical protein
MVINPCKGKGEERVKREERFWCRGNGENVFSVDCEVNSVYNEMFTIRARKDRFLDKSARHCFSLTFRLLSNLICRIASK